MTQAQTILRHIKSLGSISPQEAYRDYQITRLAARILDLKKAGYHIETEMREHPLTGTRYARYTLVREHTPEGTLRSVLIDRDAILAIWGGEV